MTKMQLQLKSAEVQLNFDGPYLHLLTVKYEV